MRTKYLIAIVLICSLNINNSSGQILNKLKQKASQTMDKALDKTLGIDEKAPSGNPGDDGNTGNNGSSTNNTSGGGLVTTPPDVQASIADAQSSYRAGSYGEARYAVQQAMLGVEMEIGNNILKSLPESISGLSKDGSADQVTSTGFGWVGLTIQREYRNDDKEFKVIVANNSMMMSAGNTGMDEPPGMTAFRA